MSQILMSLILWLFQTILGQALSGILGALLGETQ